MIGEMDSTATAEQAGELNEVVKLADKTLEIDCSELEYISSSGFRFLMRLKRASEAEGGAIRVTHLKEEIADLFRMSGFHNIFDIA